MDYGASNPWHPVAVRSAVMIDIPEWANNAATELAHSNWRVSSDLIPIIARALVKAYENGWHDRAGTMTPESHEPGSDTVRKYV